MAIWLKRGATAEAKADADRKVRDIVEAALADIEARGDVALREMSNKFDGWDRADYRLSQSEIDACVNSLSPGMFPSEHNAKRLTPEVRERLIDGTPMRRLGETDDLKAAVVFLASPGAKFTTGQILAVDGGWTVW